MAKYFIYFYLIYSIFSGSVSLLKGIIYIFKKGHVLNIIPWYLSEWFSLIRGISYLIFGLVMLKFYISGVFDEWTILIVGIILISIPECVLMYLYENYIFGISKQH